MWRVFVLFIFLVNVCNGVIYHLNETEFSRMPPLYGLDDYGSCLVPSNGTYCLVRIDLSAKPENDLIHLIHEYSAHTVKHYNHTYLQRGICVTHTCPNHIGNHSLHTTRDLTQILEGCLNETIYNEYKLQAQLTELYYCERKGQTTEIDTGDWCVLGFYISLIAINVIGTLYDIIISRTDAKGSKYIMSFSIIQNWKRLTSPESEETRAKRLTGLHGARILTLFLMFTAHVMWIHSMGFSDNIHEFEELYENAYYQMIFNGLVVVQVFFVMSGFLLVYNLEVYAEKNDFRWMLAPKIWMMRWWRLTPSYAVVLLFMTTWLRHLGSGPLWRMFVTDSVVGDCRKYWWAHLLYINNYIPDGHFCAIHTWHIATDTQLFCIGLVAYFTSRRVGGRRAVWAAIGTLVALGVLLPAVHVWMWDLDGLVLITPEFYRTMINDTFHYMHVYGHNNLVCYSLGMATGYIVHSLQKQRKDLSNNQVCAYISWLIFPSIAALFYSGSIFYVDGARAPLALRVVFGAGHRLVMGLVVAYGLIGLTMRFDTVLRNFFEWRVWVIPSRLSYSVYLLHLFIIHAHIGIKTQMGHVSTFNMTIFHLGVMALTFMIALPFSLMVEAPLMRLMKTVTTQENNNTTENTKI